MPTPADYRQYAHECMEAPVRQILRRCGRSSLNLSNYGSPPQPSLTYDKTTSVNRAGWNWTEPTVSRFVNDPGHEYRQSGRPEAHYRRITRRSNATRESNLNPSLPSRHL